MSLNVVDVLVAKLHQLLMIQPAIPHINAHHNDLDEEFRNPSPHALQEVSEQGKISMFWSEH
jgi:hypothetical protein